eukprot:5990600-Amphidinium_carterae.1
MALIGILKLFAYLGSVSRCSHLRQMPIASIPRKKASPSQMGTRPAPRGCSPRRPQKAALCRERFNRSSPSRNPRSSLRSSSCSADNSNWVAPDASRHRPDQEPGHP